MLRRQWRARVRREPLAIVFDLLGLARMQALLPRRLLAPFAIALYGIDAWRPQRRSARIALRRASHRVAISRATAERARPFLPDAPLTVLPLALEEAEPWGSVDHDLLTRLGDGFFMIVGRMAASERYKGHDVLLDALGGSSARLVIVGDGDDRERLEERTRALGLDGRVAFTGFVAEATLVALYQRCLALVMPSPDEGFGLVYLEAMRAARPCIGARGSAAAEIIVDGETGLLVDPHDVTAVREGLDRLLEQPQLATRLGQAGLARWRSHFRRAHFVERLRPIVQSLLAEATVKTNSL